MTKLNKKFLVILSIAISIIGRAQTSIHCSNDESLFKPSSNFKITGGVNSFDWTALTYETFINTVGQNNSVPITIYSPFYNPNAPGPARNKNLLPFFIAKSATGSNASIDYHPEDGWELVMKDFGSAGLSQKGVTNPMMVLYNKYTSKLRVFVCKMDKSVGNKSALIKLSIGNSAIISRKSALFSFSNALTKSIDSFDVNNTMTSTNFYENDENKYWCYADFPVAYDPCTCNYPSLLKIDFILVSEATIDLVSRITENVKEKNIENGVKISGKNLITANQFAEGLLKGAEIFHSLEKLKTDKNKIVSEFNTKTKEGVDNSFVKLFQFFIGQYAETSVLPEIGAALSIFNFFAFGGKATKSSASAQQGMPAYFADLLIKTNGRIVVTPPQSSSTFWNPGSNKTAIDLKPVWDNILGVTNLMKPPVIDVYTYTPIGGGEYYCQKAQDQHGNNLGPRNLKFSEIKEYRIKEDLLLAFNKSSNLEIFSVEAAMVFNIKHDDVTLKDGITKNIKRFYGPVETIKPNEYGNDYTERMNNIGLEIESWPHLDGKIDYITYRTAYKPISCFKGTSFRIFYTDRGQANYRKINELYIKLKFVFKRKDNPNAEPVVMLISYLPTINDLDGAEHRTYRISSIVNGVEFTGVSCYLWENFIHHLNNVPSGGSLIAPINLTIANKNITSNLSAHKTITIGPNVTISGNVEIRAGISIKLIQPVAINPNVKLIIGTIEASCDNPINNYIISDEKLNSYCALNSPYDIRTQGRVIEFDDTVPKIKNKSYESNLKVQLFPNPSSGNFTVSIFNSQAKDYSISLTDVTGKVIFTNTYNGSQTQQMIETNGLANGIYFVSIRCGDANKVEKLIIQNQN